MATLINLSDIKVNDVVSFTTYGNNIIPNVVNATVLGIESGNGLINPTLAAANANNVYPAIPYNASNPLSRDYTSYTYLRLKLQDNSQIEIAEPWINPVSLSRLDRSTVTFVAHDCDPSLISSILAIMATKGITQVDVAVS